MSRVAATRETKGGFRTDRVGKICVLVVVGLIGSSPTSAETWRVTPSISLVETLTDNVDLAPGNRKQSDLITQVAPGIAVTGTGARIKLNFDYRMNNLLYANDSARNNVQNYMDALATVEAVENWLFVDARGSITQQAISAFGAQPTTNGNVNSNRAETSTYQLSPYIRGKLGSAADYQLRYTWSTTGARGNQFADTEVEEWVGSITGRTGLATLGWALNGSAQYVHPNVGREIETTRLGGSLIYQVDPQIRVSVLGGRESNNYSGVDSKASATYGARLEWAPTQRTQISALKEKRPFGHSHDFSLTHRTPLSAWQLSDRKDITVLPNQLIPGTRGTAFELLFDALASRIPDPIARAQEVERQLRQSGTPADLALATGFLTTRVFVQRSQQASVAILGARNTLTFAAALTESRAISGAPATADDFALSSEVQQRSISVSWAHRLSPLSSVNLLATQVHSSGGAASNLDSTQSSVLLLFSHHIGPKTSGSLSVRHVRFDNSTGSGYREKAVTGSLFVTF